MQLNGDVLEHGTNRKELKDETEYIHKLKVGKKKDFQLTIASWDKRMMDELKQSGVFVIDPSQAEVTVTVQLKVRKIKYDKEDENVMPNTGNPWFTLKKIYNAEDIEEGMPLLDNEYKVLFV